MVLGDADVCMDFEPCFKFHNLASVHLKSIILGQMTSQHDLSCGGVSLTRPTSLRNFGMAYARG